MGQGTSNWKCSWENGKINLSATYEARDLVDPSVDHNDGHLARNTSYPDLVCDGETLHSSDKCAARDTLLPIMVFESHVQTGESKPSNVTGGRQVLSNMQSKKNYFSPSDLVYTRPESYTKALHKTDPKDQYQSHEGLSSTDSYADSSGLSQSTSENSLNSSRSVDSKLHRVYGTSNTYKTKVEQGDHTVKQSNKAKPSNLTGKPPQVNTGEQRERKFSFQEGRTPIIFANKDFKKKKKDARRAEIVAAVTRRLYTAKKIVETNPEHEEIAEEQQEDEDDDQEPEELKICSRARAKLQEISKRALFAHRKMKLKSEVATQTDLDRHVQRVKEVAVSTEPELSKVTVTMIPEEDEEEQDTFVSSRSQASEMPPAVCVFNNGQGMTTHITFSHRRDNLRKTLLPPPINITRSKHSQTCNYFPDSYFTRKQSACLQPLLHFQSEDSFSDDSLESSLEFDLNDSLYKENIRPETIGESEKPCLLKVITLTCGRHFYLDTSRKCVVQPAMGAQRCDNVENAEDVSFTSSEVVAEPNNNEGKLESTAQRICDLFRSASHEKNHQSGVNILRGKYPEFRLHFTKLAKNKNPEIVFKNMEYGSVDEWIISGNAEHKDLRPVPADNTCDHRCIFNNTNSDNVSFLKNNWRKPLVGCEMSDSMVNMNIHSTNHKQSGGYMQGDNHILENQSSIGFVGATNKRPIVNDGSLYGGPSEESCAQVPHIALSPCEVGDIVSPCRHAFLDQQDFDQLHAERQLYTIIENSEHSDPSESVELDSLSHLASLDLDDPSKTIETTQTNRYSLAATPGHAQPYVCLGHAEKLRVNKLSNKDSLRDIGEPTPISGDVNYCCSSCAHHTPRTPEDDNPSIVILISPNLKDSDILVNGASSVVCNSSTIAALHTPTSVDLPVETDNKLECSKNHMSGPSNADNTDYKSIGNSQPACNKMTTLPLIPHLPGFNITLSYKGNISKLNTDTSNNSDKKLEFELNTTNSKCYYSPPVLRNHKDNTSDVKQSKIISHCPMKVESKVSENDSSFCKLCQKDVIQSPAPGALHNQNNELGCRASNIYVHNNFFPIVKYIFSEKYSKVTVYPTLGMKCHININMGDNESNVLPLHVIGNNLNFRPDTLDPEGKESTIGDTPGDVQKFGENLPSTNSSKENRCDCVSSTSQGDFLNNKSVLTNLEKHDLEPLLKGNEKSSCEASVNDIISVLFTALAQHPTLQKMIDNEKCKTESDPSSFQQLASSATSDNTTDNINQQSFNILTSSGMKSLISPPISSNSFVTKTMQDSNMSKAEESGSLPNNCNAGKNAYNILTTPAGLKEESLNTNSVNVTNEKDSNSFLSFSGIPKHSENDMPYVVKPIRLEMGVNFLPSERHDGPTEKTGRYSPILQSTPSSRRDKLHFTPSLCDEVLHRSSSHGHYVGMEDDNMNSDDDDFSCDKFLSLPLTFMGVGADYEEDYSVGNRQEPIDAQHWREMQNLILGRNYKVFPYNIPLEGNASSFGQIPDQKLKKKSVSWSDIRGCGTLHTELSDEYNHNVSNRYSHPPKSIMKNAMPNQNKSFILLNDQLCQDNEAKSPWSRLPTQMVRNEKHGFEKRQMNKFNCWPIKPLIKRKRLRSMYPHPSADSLQVHHEDTRRSQSEPPTRRRFTEHGECKSDLHSQSLPDLNQTNQYGDNTLITLSTFFKEAATLVNSLHEVSKILDTTQTQTSKVNLSSVNSEETKEGVNSPSSHKGIIQVGSLGYLQGNVPPTQQAKHYVSVSEDIPRTSSFNNLVLSELNPNINKNESIATQLGDAFQQFSQAPKLETDVLSNQNIAFVDSKINKQIYFNNIDAPLNVHAESNQSIATDFMLSQVDELNDNINLNETDELEDKAIKINHKCIDQQRIDNFNNVIQKTQSLSNMSTQTETCVFNIKVNEVDNNTNFHFLHKPKTIHKNLPTLNNDEFCSDNNNVSKTIFQQLTISNVDNSLSSNTKEDMQTYCKTKPLTPNKNMKADNIGRGNYASNSIINKDQSTQPGLISKNISGSIIGNKQLVKQKVQSAQYYNKSSMTNTTLMQRELSSLTVNLELEKMTNTQKSLKKSLTTSSRKQAQQMFHKNSATSYKNTELISNSQVTDHHISYRSCCNDCLYHPSSLPSISNNYVQIHKNDKCCNAKASYCNFETKSPSYIFDTKSLSSIKCTRPPDEVVQQAYCDVCLSTCPAYPKLMHCAHICSSASLSHNETSTQPQYKTVVPKQKFSNRFSPRMYMKHLQKLRKQIVDVSRVTGQFMTHDS